MDYIFYFYIFFKGWIQRCRTCYLFIGSPMIWSDAQYHCRQLGGDLATIKDYYTNRFLARYAYHRSRSARTIWIGKFLIYSITPHISAELKPLKILDTSCHEENG